MSVAVVLKYFHDAVVFLDKKLSGKSKDEQMAEKKQELEKRLQDVTGQLGNAKKAAKKGNQLLFVIFVKILLKCWKLENLIRVSVKNFVVRR